MDSKESSTANSRPDSHEDDDRKAEAARRAAQCRQAVAEAWRASAEARWEKAEQERNAADEFLAMAEEVKSVLDGAKQAQWNSENGVGGKMSFQLQMEQMLGYLAIRFIGAGTPGEASEQFESIAEHCKLTKNNKLLIDSTRYNARLSTVDRFIFGERLQVFMRHRIKVAFFSRPEQVDSKKFGVLVARNRGVNVDVFTDFQAAEEWLLSEGQVGLAFGGSKLSW